MKDDEAARSAWLPQPPTPPRHRGRWLLVGGLALAFALALGIGALFGSTFGVANSAQAASSTLANFQVVSFAPGNANNAQVLAATPGAQGQCDALAVTSVSGSTILAKAQDGSTVTIHTTASTQYARAGLPVAASTITVGTRIHVTGTHNSDGSITATNIEIG